MAHDTHFLSRLERAADTEVRVAMSLYYDTEFKEDFVKLSHLYNLPENTDRFAVALSDSKRPSHVIMTKSGSFVTCLGPGMKMNVPVITWNKFKGLNRKYQKIESDKAEMLAFSSGEKSLGDLISRILQKSGRNMTREDFKTCMVFQPLLAPWYLEMLIDSFSAAEDLKISLQKIVRKGKIRTKREWNQVREYWNHKWIMVHTGLLAFSDITLTRSILESMMKDSELIPLWMEDRIVPTSLMAAWVTGKLGGCMFPSAKKLLLSPVHQWDYISGTLMLTSIALRHSRYRKEVTKLLKRKIRGIGPSYIGMCEDVQTNFLSSLSEYKTLVEIMPTAFEEVLKGDGNLSEKAMKEASSVAKIAFYARHERDFAHRPTHTLSMSLLLPWMISIEPEDFYIPKKYKELFNPYSFKQGLRALGNEAYKYKPGIVKDKTPGRNEPCYCGSSKKYKKCCFKKSSAKRA